MNGGTAIAGLTRVDWPVADIARAAAFMGALGFEKAGEGRDEFCGGADCLSLTSHGRELRLVKYDSPGAPYPAVHSSADLFFQHVAIVVSDMREAYGRLRQHPLMTPISIGGPQKLPPNAGSVVAFKFRDPDGHPLELIEFPSATTAPSLFLGYDHSAICVADRPRSFGFYVGALGLAHGPHSLNQGAEQARLDALDNPVVDVDALTPKTAPKPHVELLCYRRRRAGRDHAASLGDIAASQLVFKAVGLALLTNRLAGAGFIIEKTSGPNGPLLVRDPDGHLVRIEQNLAARAASG